MPITLSCACGKTMRVADEYAGRKVRCPQCKEVVAVPPAASQPPPPLAASLVEDEPAPPPRRASPPPLPAEEARFELDESPPRDTRNRRADTFDNFEDDEDEEDDDEDSRPRRSKKKKKASSGSSVNFATILGGVGMIVLAIIWFVAGYYFARRIYFYPPILAVFGLIAIVKGLLGKS